MGDKLEDSETIDIHAVALSFKPKGEVKTGEVLVAILDQAATTTSVDLKASNFVWMKAKSRYTIAKIYDRYKEIVLAPQSAASVVDGGDVNKCKLTATPSITLLHQGTAMDHSTILESLYPSHDRTITLQAVIGPVPNTDITPIPDQRKPPAGNAEPQAQGAQESTIYVSSRSTSLAISTQQRESCLSQIGVCVSNTSKPGLANNSTSTYQPPTPRLANVVEKKQNPSNDQPSDPENIAAATNAASSSSYLRTQKMLAEPSTTQLEDKVRNNKVFLCKIAVPLADLASRNPEAIEWVQEVESIRATDVYVPTVIGVVGNTGAGKSSVINALLDEERLVPTNCMRACTSVVTEISYNSSDKEEERYRAEIEFIDAEEWRKELKILLAELLDDSGKMPSRASFVTDSEIGIAFAKIRAVYPQMSREDIAATSIEQYMSVPIAQEILGETIKIHEALPGVFYSRLQRYVDSAEKGTHSMNRKSKRKKEKTGKKTGEVQEDKETIELWPLVKCVRIYTKSDALSTGAVVVDLPGIQDSNAARSAIARKYMKRCTALWIVAPINRAVDDRVAKSLLGDSFKRQLKYDGIYSRVTFICSKTDDISVTEAADSLNLQDEMAVFWGRLDEIYREKERLNNQVSEFEATKDMHTSEGEDADCQIEAWEKLIENIGKGGTVYAPEQTASKKRKKHQDTNLSRKRRVTSDSVIPNSDSESEADPQSSDDSEDEEAVKEREPLTLQQIRDSVAELRNCKKEAREANNRIKDQMLATKVQLAKLEQDKFEVDVNMNRLCITERNSYSMTAIQQDFAAGIKELDQENAIEEDGAGSFDPNDEIRNYEEVANSLPVFCVSSRGYQKLSGRLQRDSNVPGFTSVEDTKIPQLQAHCKRLSEVEVSARCKKFSNSFSQLFNSLSFWVSLNGSTVILTEAEKQSTSAFLSSRFARLETDLAQCNGSFLQEMARILSENIYEKFNPAIAIAVAQAPLTVVKWGAPINKANRVDGGLAWSTYKAVVWRDGVYSNRQTVYDFNTQLTEPIMKQLASDWEKSFGRQLPCAFVRFSTSTKMLLSAFHDAVEAQAMTRKSGHAGLGMLQQQLSNYEKIFADLTSTMTVLVNEQQRTANREFTPVITRTLVSAYAFCAQERGKGQYLRMQNHMSDIVVTKQQEMFREACKEVQNYLDEMCHLVKTLMSSKTAEVFKLIKRDYKTVITGNARPVGYIEPAEQIALRTQLAALIKEEGLRPLLLSVSLATVIS